jgi:hypothetical protein
MNMTTTTDKRMKINGVLYERLKTWIAQAVDKVFGGAEKVRAIAKEQNVLPGQMMWQLFWLVSDNICYSDQHPMFKSNKRIRFHPQDKGLWQYDEFTDEHIQTAIMRIGKELLIVC